jgi:RNA polymerase sigma-70 factor (ECF subfamily)
MRAIIARMNASNLGCPAGCATVTGLATLSDEELIQIYRAPGHQPQLEAAATELYSRYRPRITRWCFKFTRDKQSAMDLTQDVFLRAYRSLDTFTGSARFSTWIYVIARNLCLTTLERRNRELVSADAELPLETPDPCWNSLYSAIESKQVCRANCRIVMDLLSPLEAKIVMLHYGYDVPLADVSRSLGLRNKSGAKAYIVSARRKLRGLRRDRVSHAAR